MKKLILLVLVTAALAGAFFAFRWFRGETEYADAVRDLPEEAPASEAPAAPAQ